MNINFHKKTIIKFLTLAFLFIAVLAPLFTVTSYAACPTGTLTPAQKNSTDCISTGLGFDSINLSRFSPNIGVNDLVSTISTVILAILVLFFGVRVIIYGIKWVNNDGQDKSKKESIKGISNSIIGIAITFFAYFIVLAVRSFFGIAGLSGSDQLVNCASLYYRNYDDWRLNSTVTEYTGTQDTFRRCGNLAGINSTFDDLNKWATFQKNLQTCDQFVNTTSADNFEILKPKDLSECFVNEYQKLVTP